MTELTVLERRVLAFEGLRWVRPGAREQAVRDEFGMSMSRYEQLVNALVVRPEALVAEPMLVKRLLRLRDARCAARGDRRVG